MPFPVDQAHFQSNRHTRYRMARHRAEWGTRAGHCPGMGGEGTRRGTQA